MSTCIRISPHHHRNVHALHGALFAIVAALSSPAARGAETTPQDAPPTQPEPSAAPANAPTEVPEGSSNALPGGTNDAAQPDPANTGAASAPSAAPEVD